jgi:hypothetical protein
MKRRVRKIANFFAFNLLFFALYLNFIHKDKTPVVQSNQQNTAAFSGTVLVDNTENLAKKNEATATVATQKPAATVKTEQANTEALQLSIN